MHFDDRLATVLQMPVSGPAIERIQYRQLLDLLAQPPEILGGGVTVDAALARFEELGLRIPAPARLAVLRGSAIRIGNPELLARLVTAEPELAVAAIATADLPEEDWLALIPSLPVRARGILRHRRDLGAAVDRMLERLGIGDRGLPAAPQQTTRPSRPELVVLPGGAPAAPSTALEPAVAPEPAGIGAIVRQIEAFRKARSGNGVASDGADPLAPHETAARPLILALDFTTDAQGRVDWADGVLASGLVGTDLRNTNTSGETFATAMRLAQPLRDRRVTLAGAPDLAGAWCLDALPRFGRSDGRFLGYTGRLRRSAAAANPADEDSAADSMRQVLHELRTPANAIQIAAEIIQQQLYGPAPHEYRALAAAIAGDTAQILAGFEELDRLVKLETGALHPAAGECDLARIVRETIGRLHAWTNPRGSGFALAEPAEALLVGIEGEDTSRLVWRLLAALAGAAAPGETVMLALEPAGGDPTLTIDLPFALAERLHAPHAGGQTLDNGRALSSGMFGTRFTLRLAGAEAAAAGGALEQAGTQLRLRLPGLTPAAAGHTHA